MKCLNLRLVISNHRRLQPLGFGSSLSRHKLQSGQALPLAIASLVFTSAIILFVFNTFQTGSEKSQLDNTADAAAYSGMVWQARTLNFHAYTNRAMVANQVGLAQVVSIYNWSLYADITARNLDAVANIVVPLKILTVPAKQGTEAMKEATSAMAEVIIPVVDKLIDLLEKSQNIVHQATKPTTMEIVYNVVKANNDDYTVTYQTGLWLHENWKAWSDFTQSYSTPEQLIRKAKLFNPSRDPLTENRQWVLDLGNRPIRHEIRKRGSTRFEYDVETNIQGDITDVDWQWKSKDNMSHWPEKPTWRGFKIKERLPIGWGQTQLSTTGEDLTACGVSNFSNLGSRSSCTWADNRTAESTGEYEKKDLSDYSGVRSYYEVSNTDPDDEKSHDQRLSLKVEVMKKIDKMRSSDSLDGIGSSSDEHSSRTGLGPGVFKLEDQYANSFADGSGISAVAQAEVFFKRPVKRLAGLWGSKDNLKEYSNLFNPYWDVRLTDHQTARESIWSDRNTTTKISIGDVARASISNLQDRVEDKAREHILDATEDLVEPISDTIESLETQAIDMTSDIENQLNAAESQLNETITALETQYEDMNQGVENQLNNTVESLETEVTEMTQGAEKQLNNTVENFETGVTEMTQGAENQLNNTIENFETEVTEMTQGAENQLNYTVENFETQGTNSNP